MKTFLLVALLLCSSTCFAQWYTIDFDTPQSDSLLTIDTAAGNIWQIGHTTKAFFHSSDSTIAIMTDTLNPYPLNNLSTFEIRLDGVGGGMAVYVDFDHKLESDTLHDGGYLELSADGSTWTNVMQQGFEFYPLSATPVGLLENGTLAFSGIRNWEHVAGRICNTLGDTVYLRFSFYSDSVPDNKAGWLIDNITFSFDDCAGIGQYRKDNLIEIFPNPTLDKIFVKRVQRFPSSRLTVTDVTGRIVVAKAFPQNGLVDVSALPNGVYYMMYSDERSRAVKPFVVSH
jgi:hypothetical protein